MLVFALGIRKVADGLALELKYKVMVAECGHIPSLAVTSISGNGNGAYACVLKGGSWGRVWKRRARELQLF